MNKVYEVYQPQKKSAPSGGRGTLMKMILGGKLPPGETLDAELDPWTLRMAQYCCLLSEMAYYPENQRDLPPELGDIVFDERVSAKYRIPYFVMNSNTFDRIFVAIRGSYCLNDLIVDSQGRCKQWKGGWAHKGVLKTAIYLYTTLRMLLKTLSDGFGHRPITFTGHSLGASVGALCVEMFRDEFPGYEANALVFAPCSTLSYHEWEKTKNHTLSIILDGDFIPFISLHNLKNRRRKVSLSEADLVHARNHRMRRISVELWQKTVEQRVEGRPEIPLPPPSLAEALESPTAKHSSSIPLYPPGTIYVLERASESEEDETKRIYLKTVKSMTYFGHFPNNLNEGRHSITLYVQWLDNCCDYVMPEGYPPFFPQREEFKQKREEEQRLEKERRKQRREMIDKLQKKREREKKISSKVKKIKKLDARDVSESSASDTIQRAAELCASGVSLSVSELDLCREFEEDLDESPRSEEEEEEALEREDVPEGALPTGDHINFGRPIY